VPLAIFDLDNTLLDGDSDHLWGVFLAEQGVVNRAEYERENDRFFEAYKEGKLDIFEFLQFSLKPLSEHSVEKLQHWHQQFMQQMINPIIHKKGLSLIQQHRDKGDTLMIITATNSFVTAPIAKTLGIEHLIATDPELKAGRYTGKVMGMPSFQQGKVERLNKWLLEHNANLSDSTFYSDSHNDIPLLEIVDHAVAVDPDAPLRAAAKNRGWPVISLHEDKHTI